MQRYNKSKGKGSKFLANNVILDVRNSDIAWYHVEELLRFCNLKHLSCILSNTFEFVAGRGRK